jgi:hypothetical protein
MVIRLGLTLIPHLGKELSKCSLRSDMGGETPIEELDGEGNHFIRAQNASDMDM